MKLLLIGALLVCAVSAWGQITISRAQYPDSVGYSTQYLTSGFVDVTLGTTGGPQTWDFTTIPATSAFTVYTDVSPDSTPYPATHNWGSSRFASVAQEGILGLGNFIGGGIAWTYFRYGTNDYEVIGFGVPDDSPLFSAQADSVFTTARVANFPLSYNENWTDSLKTYITLHDTVLLGTSHHMRAAVLMRIANTVDGYGTLLYPGDSVQALRSVSVISGMIQLQIQFQFIGYQTIPGVGQSIPAQTTVSYVAQDVGALVSATSDTGVTTPDFTYATTFRQSSRHYTPTSVRQPQVRFSLPSSAQLAVYPNPFNPTTQLSFASPVGGKASVVLFDVLGRKVAVLYSGTISSGLRYRAQWGGEYPAGSYFARFSVNGITTTTRLERLP